MSFEPCLAQTSHYIALYLALLSLPLLSLLSLELKLFHHLQSCLKFYLDASNEILWHSGLGLWMEQQLVLE
jgi:hypothetical protein